ncbi:MAG: hypothetical protein JNK82_17005 [Myxococcaceae bacterium]|nr:hypothetical protein [Myxococcaceae bacterium]
MALGALALGSARCASPQRVTAGPESCATPEACSALASQLAPTERGRAIALYERGCELGDARACGRRALHENGSGGDGWAARATVGLGASCDSGDAESCEVLAALHRRGAAPEGAAAGARALELHDARCAGGDAGACLRVGVLLDEGGLVPPEPARALARHLRACDLGLAGGCAAAGLKFMRGEGVAPDRVRGAELLRRAKAAMPSPDAGR